MDRTEQVRKLFNRLIDRYAMFELFKGAILRTLRVKNIYLAQISIESREFKINIKVITRSNQLVRSLL